jgi:hypothetical protein
MQDHMNMKRAHCSKNQFLQVEDVLRDGYGCTVFLTLHSFFPFSFWIQRRS